MANWVLNTGRGNATGIRGQSFSGITPAPPAKPEADPFEDSFLAMGDDEFATAVKQAQDDAVMYVDGYVGPYRSQATRFYRGDPFGNEEEGRSQIVMTDVRDTVLTMLPSLLRIFTSSEDAVVFEPNTVEKVEIAEQQTDYVNHLFFCDNPGFTNLYNVFKDALIRKTGILKYYWDERIEVSELEFTGLTDGQMHVLNEEDGVFILEQERYRTPDWEPQENVFDMQTGQPQQQESPWLTDVKVRRYVKRNRVTIEALPPEEFLCSRNSRDPETAPYLGHRSIKTLSDLVAMGYDRTWLESLPNNGDTFILNDEAQTRNPAVNSFMQTADINDPMAAKVVYVENYIRIDRDGDGIAELHKVCTVSNVVLHDEVVDEAPFALFCPDPEPHTLIGSSVADQTMDLQLLKSNVMRGTLDSLAQSIHPRTAVVEGQVNLDDVMNVETGAIIRMRQPGMVQPFSEPFVGQNAMPIIEWIDNLRAARTGIIPATAGLDPDVLQSTTASAVSAAIAGAQERTEMTARLFAETGMRRAMRGILKLVVRHQDKPRLMRLRGKWVEADPRMWDALLDVKVNIALGRGDDTKRIQSLIAIAAKQEQIIQLLGPMNPLSDVSQYRNTLAKITELMGYKDVNQFWKPVDMKQIAEEQANKPPPPDPNMVLAQAQMTKAQGEVQAKQQQNQIETQRIQIEDQREREKAKLNALVELQRIEATFAQSGADRDQQAETSRAQLLGDLLKHSTAEHNRASQEAQASERDQTKYEVDSAMSFDREERDRRQDMVKHRLALDSKERQARLAAEARAQAAANKPKTVQ